MPVKLPVYCVPNLYFVVFLWRIITSSAKPEKRIVAHKASIIEIVKITIEGAHEPLRVRKILWVTLR